MSAPPLPEIFGNYALKEFVEVVAPDSISWVPQTVGWLWLVLGLAAACAHYGWKKLRVWYVNRYRREAAQQLAVLAMSPAAESVIADINRLLKLVALTAYSREEVARLSGQPWANFLNRQCDSPIFTGDQMQLLATGSYRTVEIDESVVRGLLQASLTWVRAHRGVEDA